MNSLIGCDFLFVDGDDREEVLWLGEREKERKKEYFDRAKNYCS